MAGKWKKPPEKLVEAFERAVAKFPNVERRQMFGCPCAFVNGNMAGGLHEGRWIIRLKAAERRELLACGGGEFAPMGRVMKEYATLPDGVVADASRLQHWLVRSFAYVRSLPAKPAKARVARRPPKIGA